MARKVWTQEEDQLLSKIIEQRGHDDWTANSNILKMRCATAKKNQRNGKQCRQRWYNHLNPQLDKTCWCYEQESKVFQLHRIHGNKWKQISKQFPGRTDSNIKNKFFSIMRKSLRRINKHLGYKSSTNQIREIKPSVMTEILNFIYENQTLPLFEKQSLEELPQLLFSFSYYKKQASAKKSLSETDNKKIQTILELLDKFKKLNKLKKAHKQKQVSEINTLHGENLLTKLQESSCNHDPPQKFVNNDISNALKFPVSVQIYHPNKTYQDSGKGVETYESINIQNNFDNQDEQIFYRCSMRFDEQSNMNKAFVPFQDPSVSFQSQFEDLIVVGKHIQPVFVENNIDFLDGQNVLDEIIEQKYNS